MRIRNILLSDHSPSLARKILNQRKNKKISYRPIYNHKDTTMMAGNLPSSRTTVDEDEEDEVVGSFCGWRDVLEDAAKDQRHTDEGVRPVAHSTRVVVAVQRDAEVDTAVDQADQEENEGLRHIWSEVRAWLSQRQQARRCIRNRGRTRNRAMVVGREGGRLLVVTRATLERTRRCVGIAWEWCVWLRWACGSRSWSWRTMSLEHRGGAVTAATTGPPTTTTTTKTTPPTAPPQRTSRTAQRWLLTACVCLSRRSGGRNGRTIKKRP